jgi:hypothetical protein
MKARGGQDRVAEPRAARSLNHEEMLEYSNVSKKKIK